MPHKYEWKTDQVTSTACIPPTPSHCVLDIPEPLAAKESEGYPVRGAFRLEYELIRMDGEKRLWIANARLFNLKGGSQSCTWHEDGIMEEPGKPIRDTVMERYLAWARRKQEEATALVLLMQRAWDCLHPDEYPDHP